MMKKVNQKLLPVAIITITIATNTMGLRPCFTKTTS